jgi:hypothetical protein
VIVLLVAMLRGSRLRRGRVILVLRFRTLRRGALRFALRLGTLRLWTRLLDVLWLHALRRFTLWLRTLRALLRGRALELLLPLRLRDSLWPWCGGTLLCFRT